MRVTDCDKTELIAYTDASYDDKEKIAGWGVVIQIRRGGVTKEHAYKSYLPCSNNNFAELFAIHQALILLAGSKYRKSDTEVIILTDSQTALDYINGLRGREYERKHMKEWTKQQWVNHKRMQLYAYRINKMCVGTPCQFIKVKGHCRDFREAHLVNNLADTYAKFGRSLYYIQKKARER